MENFDYRVLADVVDDVLLLEWDIAVGREDLCEFAARARSSPGRVRVAPYRIYHASRSNRAYPEAFWAPRRYEGTPEAGTTRPVAFGEPTCHLFPLGMTYLPRAHVVAFLEYVETFPEGRVNPFDDGAFSGWHHRYVEAEVPLDWDLRPVHLHYPTPKVD